MITAEHYEVVGDCWIWQRGLRNGYGVIWRESKPQYAHRVAFAEANGPIPEGKQLHHTCATRACINPAHLVAVTHWEHAELEGHGSRAQAVRARKLAEAGLPHSHIACAVGLTQGTVSAIVRGEKWKHLGEPIPRRRPRLAPTIVREIRTLYDGGWLQKDIAAAYEVSQPNVSAIGRRCIWRELEVA